MGTVSKTASRRTKKPFKPLQEKKTTGEVASKAVLQAENKDSKNSSYRGEDYSTGTGLTDVGVLDLPGSEDCCGDISCSEDPLSCLQCISLPFRLCLICLG